MLSHLSPFLLAAAVHAVAIPSQITKGTSPNGSSNLADAYVALIEDLRRDVPGPMRVASIVQNPDASEVVVAALLGDIATPEGIRYRLARNEESLLLDVVRELGRDPVVAALRPRVDAADAERKAEFTDAALRVLDAIGTARDLRLALDSMPKRRNDLETEHSIAFSRTVGNMVAREPHSLPFALSAFYEGGAQERLALVRAVGASGIEGRSEWLADRLRYDDSLDLTILCELARPTNIPIFAPQVGGSIAPYMRGEDPATRLQAVRAMGNLGTFAYLPALIDVVEFDDRATIRIAATQSLARIAGVNLGTSPIRWRSWLATESEWFEGPAQRLIKNLGDRTSSVVERTLRDLSQHRYERHTIALEIAPILDDPDDRLRSAALDAIRTLGSCAVLDDVAALADDETLGQRANDTLRALTNLDVPRKEDEQLSRQWEAAIARAQP